jgi:hypothetical protein
MVKTREFGQPCRAPQPGRCRICGCNGMEALYWADETKTLCNRAACIAEARREIGR